MKEVTVQELKELMDSGADFQLIDVREPHEYDICNLNGELIPQGDIPDNVDKIDPRIRRLFFSAAAVRAVVTWFSGWKKSTAFKTYTT